VSIVTLLVAHGRCPECRASALRPDDNALTCTACGTLFPMVDGKPVMMRADNAMFPRAEYVRNQTSPASPSGALRRLVPSRSVNLEYRRLLRAFADALQEMGGSLILVVGAGSQRRWLDPLLAYAQLQFVYSAVDTRATVDLHCDASDLPFRDGVFDGVIASAVLEHVADPQHVVAEMRRVLKPRGLIYSEIPFLQQVHEGAYDFTRFTLSGHRRLLNGFEELQGGVVAGPGTTLAWALEHFVISFSPSTLRRPIRVLSRLVFGWVKYFDYLLGQSRAAADGASCTFLLGRKSPVSRTDVDIIERYSGLSDIRHV
jgi:SAM-dependent methyltransferase